jgi:carbon storage regulator
MLVLTRRIGESVLIGGEITVTVLDIKGDSIRLGIDAPRQTRIQRAEIVEAVGEENVSATAGEDTQAEDAIVEALTRRRPSGS